MVFINEWLPYPYDGAAAQFIELWNSGEAPVSLHGWRLEKGNGKIFKLDGRSIPANGYLVLTRGETKLAIKHSGESLALYDSEGILQDRSSFAGSAKKGKSFSRADAGTGPAEHFIWTSATPGAANQALLYNEVSEIAYPRGVAINHASLTPLQIFGFTFAAGAILAALVVYFVKHDAKLSKLFWARDDRIWP